MCVNNAHNSTIQTTPFMLNYGQHPNTPVALFLRNTNPRVNKFVGRWSEQLQIAKKCIEAAQQRQKLRLIAVDVQLRYCRSVTVS